MWLFRLSAAAILLERHPDPLRYEKAPLEGKRTPPKPNLRGIRSEGMRCLRAKVIARPLIGSGSQGPRLDRTSPRWDRAHC